ncbi:ROK family protein [Latilactobacillus graminis]|uniref:ROK family protein n=2 Tax=Latilactobacillus graminis TaxID=60519 RepID=A0AA89I2I4_9LACO|nr:ROK family protein [Latilactobacillus graminis]KRM24491.1 ROK family protein [Latilactobacillus graminis DSM 20719]QFP79051.1 ROK family protein [Latilactobacillus graminis]
MSQKTLLVLDIGGSAVKYGLWSNQQLTNQAQFPTPLTRNRFFTIIAQLCDQFNAEFQITGIAVSCPGQPDERTGIIHGVSYVPFLHHGAFQTEFTNRLALPVSFQNDADSAALAEMTAGIGQGHQDALFTIIGSGVGLAIIKNGILLKTAANKIDNFEKFIADTIKTLNNAKVSPVQIGKTVSLKNFKLPNTIDGKTVFELAEQGDPIATQEITQMYTALAEIILFLNVAYAPEIIGIGGGISRRTDLLPKLTAAIEATLANPNSSINHYWQYRANAAEAIPRPVIQICHFSQDANLIGAVYHFLEHH